MRENNTYIFLKELLVLLNQIRDLQKLPPTHTNGQKLQNNIELFQKTLLAAKQNGFKTHKLLLRQEVELTGKLAQLKLKLKSNYVKPSTNSVKCNKATTLKNNSGSHNTNTPMLFSMVTKSKSQNEVHDMRCENAPKFQPTKTSLMRQDMAIKERNLTKTAINKPYVIKKHDSYGTSLMNMQAKLEDSTNEKCVVDINYLPTKSKPSWRTLLN